MFVGGPLDGQSRPIQDTPATVWRFPMPDIEPAAALRFGPEADIWPTTFTEHVYRLAARLTGGTATYDAAIYEYQGIGT